ncbi:FtsB family cell division protein [Streptomyces wuyuanensis]|uniref:FtsB family cell division protein n=1 Tax=Streptomyces wuyuanensis TaxID=1196353 RepID=UPI003D71899A
MRKAAGQLKGRAARLARLMPSGPSTAARTPFVLLVVVLLGGGLITLLLLNTSLNEGSFRLSELRKKTTELTDQEQALQRDVDERSAPDALERRARELGMVPGGNPAFLGPDGTVRGVPKRATADPSAVRRPEAPARPVGPPAPAPPPASGAPALPPASPKPSAAGAPAASAAPPAPPLPSASGAPKPPPTTPGR